MLQQCIYWNDDSDDEEENIPPVEQTAENLTNAMVDNTVTKEIRSRVDLASSQVSPTSSIHLACTSLGNHWQELAHRIQDVTFPLDKQVIRNAADSLYRLILLHAPRLSLSKTRFSCRPRKPMAPEVHCFMMQPLPRLSEILHHEIPSLLDEYDSI